jgi:hypothetical protein
VSAVRSLRHPASVLLAVLTLGLVAATLPGCARKQNEATVRYTAVNEAYGLLDKGQTSRAIALLEDILRDEPYNAEARVMLASAYMGRAGIDVLSMHDAFKDVLFSRSLSDVFFSGGKKAPDLDGTGKPVAPRDPLTGAPGVDGRDSVTVTPAERLFEKIDEFLNNIRRVLVILDRFPRVPPAKWPLLEQALLNLSKTPLQREVRLYRMFIRLIYLKEVLVTRVIRDSTFATRKWACNLELDQLHDSLTWISTSLAEISEDFIEVYPRDGSPFTRVEALFKVFRDELGELEASAPAGGETATMIGERRIREAFHCAAGGEGGEK